MSIEVALNILLPYAYFFIIISCNARIYLLPRLIGGYLQKIINLSNLEHFSAISKLSLSG